MAVFKSIGHFFTVVGKDVKVVAKAVSSFVSKDAPKVQEAGAVLGPILAAISPSAGAVEEIAMRLFGDAVAAVQAGQAAAGASGLNLTLDQEVVAAIKALAPDLEAFAVKLGYQKPKA